MDYRCILEELRAGKSPRTIASLGLASRNTVRSIARAVERLGWLYPDVPMPDTEAIRRVLAKEPPIPVRASSVEHFRAKVEAWARDGYTAKQIHGRLQRDTAGLVGDERFAGSVGAVKRFLAQLRRNNPTAYVVMRYEPGETAQVDFGSGPMLPHPETGRATRTHVFVMTLCHSRHMYAEIVWNQKISTWLGCHRNAFEFFGGVPGSVVIDNLKSAITRACKNDPVVCRSYADAARDWGFQIKPCRPRTPRHKGQVERGVRFIKQSFLPLREFNNLANANQQLWEWLLEVGNRVHGTTHEVPLQVFAERERPALKPLPDPRPEAVFWATAKLHSNCHLAVEKAFYSAPHRHVHEYLDVRVGERLVQIWRNGQLLAVHARAERPGDRRTLDEHYPPEKAAHLEKTPQWCRRRAELVGPACVRFVEQLLGDRVLDRLTGAQGVLRLGEKYGRTRLEAACARALAYEAIEYRSIKNILVKGLDQAPELPDASGQLHLPFVEVPRFARDIGRMLAG